MNEQLLGPETQGSENSFLLQQYRSVCLSETFSDPLKMEIPQILRKSIPAIKNYDSEKETHIKLELAQENIKALSKLQNEAS